MSVFLVGAFSDPAAGDSGKRKVSFHDQQQRIPLHDPSSGNTKRPVNSSVRSISIASFDFATPLVFTSSPSHHGAVPADRSAFLADPPSGGVDNAFTL
jgi:hypothetical protein